MWSKFRTEVFGKWVLVGEHSVLRGATAIALPQVDLKLGLTFDPSSAENGFRVEPESAQRLVEDLLNSIRDAWDSEGRSFPQPCGLLKIESTIPMGAGLGSSAALCVALTRWMSGPLSIPDSEICDFATRLEHRFHGRSSGMDVAVISAAEPISYVMGREMRPLGVKKLPRFTFHDTELRSRTSDCVLKVEKFREDSPLLAMRVDDAMGEASRWAVEGLIRYDSGDLKEGLALIQRAMIQGRECFYHWKLVPEAAQEIEERLLRQGALAVKLTGAGGGGMVVALWP